MYVCRIIAYILDIKLHSSKYCNVAVSFIFQPFCDYADLMASNMSVREYVHVCRTHTKLAVSLSWCAGQSDNNILRQFQVDSLFTFYW